MSEPLLNPGEAAGLLGVDKRTLGRYVKKKILHPVLLPGGQHRYRREELERLAAGDSSARDTSSAPVSTVQNMENELKSVNLQAALRQAKRNLAMIEAEDQAAAYEKAEAQRAAAVADKRALAEMRLSQSRERKELKAAHAQEIAQRERRTWESEITNAALGLLPRDVPADVKAAVIESIHGALESSGPGHTQRLIAIAVSGAIDRALKPWRRDKEIKRVIRDAEWSLPSDMRGLGSPTQWQIRFRAAADVVIRALPAEASLNQVHAIARGEARKLAAEFERGQVEERYRRSCDELVESVRWHALAADRDAAREAVATAIARLPLGSEETELRSAADRALAPFVRRKEMAACVENFLDHVGVYVEELGAPDGDWDLGDYFARRELAERLKKKIRPRLIGALLTGEVEVEDREAQDFIEDAVDAELDG